MSTLRRRFGFEKRKETKTTMKTSIKFLLILVLFLLSSPSVVACTSFVLDSDGFAVFGANFDFRIHEGLLFINKRNVTKTAFFNPSTTGEYAQWTSKYGSVTFNVVGYQFAYAGMNEAGLVISTLFLDITENPPPDERPPLEAPFWVQYQLDNAGTIEEVIASDSVVRMATINNEHYLVCDKTGSSAVIEFIEGEMVVHTDETMPVKALTNNTYEESIDSWKKSRPWMFWKFLERRFWKSSLIRFEIAADRVKSFDENDKDKAVEYAFDTLEKTRDDAESNPTQWSIVFDTENLKIHFHTRTNPEIRSITLAKLDFSCTMPARMLDIHENLSGDISNDFMEYSHEVSFNHFLRYFEKWGLVDISPEEIKELTEHLESFECSQLKE